MAPSGDCSPVAALARRPLAARGAPPAALFPSGNHPTRSRLRTSMSWLLEAMIDQTPTPAPSRCGKRGLQQGAESIRIRAPSDTSSAGTCPTGRHGGGLRRKA